MKIDLAGKIAVVTGGSRGIGHAIARALAVAGAQVAVLGRDAAKAQAAAHALSNGAARGYGCDVGDAAQVETTVAAVAPTTVAPAAPTTVTDITLPQTGSGVGSMSLVGGAALLVGAAALALTRRRRQTV